MERYPLQPHNQKKQPHPRKGEETREETMTEWLARQASSHQAQLVATAVVSGLAVAGTIYGVQAFRRAAAVEDLKASIPDISDPQNTEKLPTYEYPIAFSVKTAQEDEQVAKIARRGDYSDDLVEEQLTRTSSFLTPPRLSLLRSSFIIVVGLGGVGSHCTAALARSGVSRLRIIDFDQVTLSSLNRHALATLSDVGTPKVLCVRKRLEAVAPWIQWECCNEVWQEAQAERLLGGWDGGKGQTPDYVVDAIDNIDGKVALLKYCHGKGIRVISSMGAGCKSDPTKVFVGDLSASTEDPLSRATRRRLRMVGISEGIPVVYSTEKPGPGKASLLPLPEEEFQKGNVGELSVLPDFRARILPVIGTMPAVFGYAIANYIIMEITRYPHETISGKGRDKVYESILGSLQVCEERLAKFYGENVVGLKIPVNIVDVGYLVDEVFRGKSVVSGLSTRLTLVRWRAPGVSAMDKTWAGQKNVRLKLSELVCMTKEEAAKHEVEVLKGGKSPQEVYSKDVVDVVEMRGREEEMYSMYR